VKPDAAGVLPTSPSISASRSATPPRCPSGTCRSSPARGDRRPQRDAATSSSPDIPGTPPAPPRGIARRVPRIARAALRGRRPAPAARLAARVREGLDLLARDDASRFARCAERSRNRSAPGSTRRPCRARGRRRAVVSRHRVSRRRHRRPGARDGDHRCHDVPAEISCEGRPHGDGARARGRSPFLERRSSSSRWRAGAAQARRERGKRLLKRAFGPLFPPGSWTGRRWASAPPWTSGSGRAALAARARLFAVSSRSGARRAGRRPRAAA